MKHSAISDLPFSRILLSAAVVLAAQPLGVAESNSVASKRNGQIVRDVRLSKQHQAVFHLVDDAGQPLAKERVRFRYKQKTIADVRSDAAGRVAVSGLRPGVHVITTRQGSFTFRFWAFDSAPPNALNAPAVVFSKGAVRGQMGPGVMGPAVIATGVAATALVVVLVGKSSASDHQPTPASP